MQVSGNEGRRSWVKTYPLWFAEMLVSVITTPDGDLFVAFISFISYAGFQLGRFVRRTMMATSTLDPVALPASQEGQVHALHELLQKEGKSLLIGKGGEPAMELPDAVYDLLLKILIVMEEGKAISIVPVMQDLTTQQAAELLGVSRPFFVKLLETGNLPYHLTGTHRRVYLKDLLAYKQHRDQDRHAALERMAEEADQAGLYDKVLLPEA
jgi:excisionase family DNA binding protein